MFLKVLLISIVLVAIILLSLGIKLWFDPKAEFTVHSCALEDGTLDNNGACSSCHIKDLANCPEKNI
jgi:hypothetical protein